MKRRNLFLGLLLCVTTASAQDVITKTDGTKVDAKVEEITETAVKYRKATNLTGPIYSIPITSVWTIVYENGSTDTFSTPGTGVTATPDTDNPLPNTPTNGLYNEETMRHARSLSPSSGASGLNDFQLLRMNQHDITPEKLYKAAKKKRAIGWIGGGVILCVGTIVAYSVSDDGYGGLQMENFAPTIGGAAVGAAIWCVGFNLKANSLVKKAREMEMYTSPIIENEVFHAGGKSFVAGISTIGSYRFNNQALGLSLKYNF